MIKACDTQWLLNITNVTRVLSPTGMRGRATAKRPRMSQVSHFALYKGKLSINI